MKKQWSLLFLFAFALVFINCEQKQKKSGFLFEYLPKDAEMVFKISNWNTFTNDIKNNALIAKSHSPLLTVFSDNKTVLDRLSPDSESLFALVKKNEDQTDYLYLTKHFREVFTTDSTSNKTVETLKINNIDVNRIDLDNTKFFTSTTKDSIFIASSSQQLLIDVLDGKTYAATDFAKLMQLPATDGLTAYFRGDQITTPDSTHINFTTWNALDLHLAPESFKAHGISLPLDTIPQLLDVFKGQHPQPNDLAKLTPMNAKSTQSFTFHDVEKLQENLRKYRGETSTSEPTGIFDSASEIGIIELSSNAPVVFIKSIDPSITFDALARYVSSESTFRDVEIKQFSEPELFKTIYAPLITFDRAHYVFELDDFFVFSETKKAAEELIGAYLNQSTIENAATFKDNFKDLSASSSWMALGVQGTLPEIFSSLSNIPIIPSNQDLSNFSFLALQYSMDRDFAHITLSCNQNSGKSTRSVSKGITEKFHISLNDDIIAGPQIFEGNSTNILVQDANYVLHFVSESGKTLWTKSLSAPVLGDFAQVDLYKNGNQQIAFATENTVYILDRNGKDVAPFPLKFRDKITQPLSVFDYDGNHEYRFVVTQGQEVLMYDKKAKTVTGFSFRKAGSTIVQAPKHIRMGNKDYIVIPEQNGKLNILNRQGRSRVRVDNKFKFSDIPITYEGTKFVVITEDYNKVSISDRGEAATIKLDVGAYYWFAVNHGVKATLDDNLLRIDGKLANLPLGIYSEPQLVKISGSVYTAITETQEKKVYLFDENAKLVSGFPIFGASKASIGTRSGKNTYVVVRGDAKDVVVYQLN